MEIQFRIDDQKQGSFYIEQNDRQIAELDFEINGNKINACHTGVRNEFEGRGIAGKLFDKLIEYSRANNYKIIPSCPYIRTKLQRNPEGYIDVWTGE